jgi:hypothetical protein
MLKCPARERLRHSDVTPALSQFFLVCDYVIVPRKLIRTEDEAPWLRLMIEGQSKLVSTFKNNFLKFRFA